MRKYLATALLALTAALSLHAEIITYPVPKQLYYARHNDTYTVQVRQHGDTFWTDLYEYNVKVDMDTQSDATFVQFDFSGTIDIRVQKNNGIVQHAEVRPLSKGIRPKRKGNELTFTIDRPQHLSVELDGDTDDITVRHSVLWSDIAHAINIGTHGDTSHTGETIENLTFTDLDILEHDEDDPEYQGCLSINTGDHNLARHILFDNIRVERIEEGQLFHIRVMYNEKYNTGPGRSVQDVTFRNIDCLTPGIPLSVIKGYDEEHHVDGIIFERIRVNGKRIRSLDKLNIKTGKYVKEVSIR